MHGPPQGPRLSWGPRRHTGIWVEVWGHQCQNGSPVPCSSSSPQGPAPWPGQKLELGHGKSHPGSLGCCVDSRPLQLPRYQTAAPAQVPPWFWCLWIPRVWRTKMFFVHMTPININPPLATAFSNSVQKAAAITGFPITTGGSQPFLVM